MGPQCLLWNTRWSLLFNLLMCIYGYSPQQKFLEMLRILRRAPATCGPFACPRRSSPPAPATCGPFACTRSPPAVPSSSSPSLRSSSSRSSCGSSSSCCIRWLCSDIFDDQKREMAVSVSCSRINARGFHVSNEMTASGHPLFDSVHHFRHIK